MADESAELAAKNTPAGGFNPTASIGNNSSSQYTFFLHRGSAGLPEVSSQDGTPLVDRYAHARTKRKRTRPEDFSILEAEYERNQRPDKAARVELTQRVAMTEKEVQIWFQNRRQMTRRKCRTWQKNEISNIIRSASQDDASSGNEDRDQSFHSQSSPIGSNNEDLTRVDADSSSKDTLAKERAYLVAESSFASNSIETFPELPSQSRVIPSEPTEDAARVSLSSQDLPCEQNSTVELKSGPLIDCSTSRFTSEASSLSYPDTTYCQPTLDKSMVSCSAAKERSPLRRTSSLVRLALSTDGTAKVVANNGKSPSPDGKKSMQAPSTRRAGGLQRSQSAVSLNSSTSFDQSTIFPPWPRRGFVGRSRDARTWEFYCDADSRDALTIAAEHEQKGSAAAAISLIRSTSATKKTLTPSTKHNSKQLHRQGSGKRKVMDEHHSLKPKLARTVSALESYQSSEKELRGVTKLWPDPQGDSDKENWSPNGQQQYHRIRADQSDKRPHLATSRIFGESGQQNDGNGRESLVEREARQRARRRRLKEAAAAAIRKDAVDVDTDVSSFMGARDVKEDELDAVQQLLSLSQGAWAR